jgi:hypothetical protein
VGGDVSFASSVAKTGKVGKQTRAESVARKSGERCEERHKETEGPPGMMTKAQGEGPPP